jgi:hypothetical protein
MGSTLSAPSDLGPNEHGVRMGALYNYIYGSLSGCGYAFRWELTWGQKALVFAKHDGGSDVTFTAPENATKEEMGMVRRFGYGDGTECGKRLVDMLFDTPTERQVWLNTCWNMSAVSVFQVSIWGYFVRRNGRGDWSCRGGTAHIFTPDTSPWFLT